MSDPPAILGAFWGGGVIDELPKSVSEFEEKFSTEAACAAFVRRLRFPEGFRCPRCAGAASWALHKRRLEECRQCGHQVSITAGTMFARTRKPLRLWFRVLADFLTDKRGTSALSVSRRHGLSYQTAWTWLHKIRSGMKRAGEKKLNDRVEADTMFRPKLGKLPIVLGAVEVRRPSSGRLRLGAQAGSQDLVEFLGKNVEPRTLVKTEAFPWIDRIREHRLLPYPWRAAKLPAIDNIFWLLHRQVMGTYHGGMSAKYWQAYLDEFVFRFNRRTSKNRWLLVLRAVQDGLKPVPTRRALVASTGAK